MKISGHWFCERCDDVVTLPLPGRGSVPVATGNILPEKCPICHYRTVIWIPHVETHRPVSDEIARDWFGQMRQIVETTR